MINSNFSKGSRVLADLIDSSDGKIVSVDFIKKDGSMRTLVGRIGVTKYLRGGKKTTDDSKFVTIYDIQNHGYRSVNRDSILALRQAGVEAVVVK
jgi:hypothetical protein